MSRSMKREVESVGGDDSYSMIGGGGDVEMCRDGRGCWMYRMVERGLIILPWEDGDDGVGRVTAWVFGEGGWRWGSVRGVRGEGGWSGG